MVYSENKTPKKKENKRKNKDETEFVTPNPFDTKWMRPYHAQAEYSPTNEVYTPENNAKWGALTKELQPSTDKQQQGFMSITEVAGDNATTSSTANPKYKIPKKPTQ